MAKGKKSNGFARAVKPTKLKISSVRKKTKKQLQTERSLPVTPDAWGACQKRLHRHCAKGPILVQPRQVTSGLVTGDAAYAACKWESCSCPCHTDTTGRYEAESKDYERQARHKNYKWKGKDAH